MQDTVIRTGERILLRRGVTTQELSQSAARESVDHELAHPMSAEHVSTMPGPVVRATPGTEARPASVLPHPFTIFTESSERERALVDVDAVARLIEHTLRRLQAPAQLVRAFCGPRLLGFDLQPDAGVEAGRIVELQDKLMRVLAVSRVWFRAPCRGNCALALEIPVPTPSVLTIRDLLRRVPARIPKTRLAVPLGLTATGDAVVADLSRLPHLLIAGDAGSGKSTILETSIASLVCRNAPDRLRLVVINTESRRLSVFDTLPHLLCPIVFRDAHVAAVLRWCAREIDLRYRQFARHAAASLSHYNARMAVTGGTLLPEIVLVIDELASAGARNGRASSDALVHVARWAGGAGIHLVVSTGRPPTDVRREPVLANLKARVACRITTETLARTILDEPGAEALVGGSDMLYKAPDAAIPLRLQGATVSAAEIERLIGFWNAA